MKIIVAITIMKIIVAITATLALVSADRANRLGVTSRERNLQEPLLTAQARFIDMHATVKNGDNFVIGELEIKVVDGLENSQSCLKLVDMHKYDGKEFADELHNFDGSIRLVHYRIGGTWIEFFANTRDSGRCPHDWFSVKIRCKIHQICEQFFSTKSSACQYFQDAFEVKHYVNDGTNECSSDAGICEVIDWPRLYYPECGDGDEEDGDWIGSGYNEEGFSFRAFITCDDTQVTGFNACVSTFIDNMC